MQVADGHNNTSTSLRWRLKYFGKFAVMRYNVGNSTLEAVFDKSILARMARRMPLLYMRACRVARLF